MKKFVIISEARTGSNMLMSILNSIPEIYCHAELFHPKKIFSDIFNIPYTLYQRDLSPISFLEAVEEQTCHNTNASFFGFKLFFNHNRKVMDYIISNKNYKIILITRKNSIAQYASHRRALKSNIWSSFQGDSNNTTINFVLSEYILFKIRSFYRINLFKLKAKIHNRDYINTKYEDLIEGNFKKIEDFFDIDKNIMNIDASTYKKQMLNQGESYMLFSNKHYVKFLKKIFIL
ncbi:MAG: hypothetical protein ACL93V_17220 [Candidatus Electrothrix sp. YB6]